MLPVTKFSDDNAPVAADPTVPVLDPDASSTADEPAPDESGPTQASWRLGITPFFELSPPPMLKFLIDFEFADPPEASMQDQLCYYTFETQNSDFCLGMGEMEG